MLYRRLDCILCEGFALALQQVVTGLGALEFALHQPERLSGWENGLPSLKVVHVLAMCVRCYGVVWDEWWVMCMPCMRQKC